MKPTPLLAVLLAATLLAAACSTETTDPIVCPPVVSHTVVVTALDSISGANVTAGATLVLRNAQVTDSVVVPPQVGSYGIDEGRLGTYTLTVRQTGYREWSRPDVKLEPGNCGPALVNINARLQAAP